MLWEVWRYFESGWILRYYIDPGFYFTYFGFHWVLPWPGNGMDSISGCWACWPYASPLGALYRLTTGLFFLG